MVVVIHEDQAEQLRRLPDRAADLILVAVTPFEVEVVRSLAAIAEEKLTENGHLIIAPTLTEALLNV